MACPSHGMAWVREVRACSAQDRRIPRDLSYHGPILTEGNESGISSWFEVDDTHTHTQIYTTVISLHFLDVSTVAVNIYSWPIGKPDLTKAMGAIAPSRPDACPVI